MESRHRSRIPVALAVSNCGSRPISIIKPEMRGFVRWIDSRQLYPDHCQLVDGIEFFDMKLEFGLVVR